MSTTRSEVRDGMRIDWDVAIMVDDGLVLRADVFRPVGESKFPVILSYGPYAKGTSFQHSNTGAWNAMVAAHPDVPYGSTNKYQNWEAADPEKWVSEGYVIIRIDSRGAGRSPGFLDHFSARETNDLYQCIEWAAVQPWSNGKVGLNGISYYAMNQWLIAGKQPPHLAAMCIWEGAADWYRDSTHQGGILNTFWASWQDIVKTVQYGLGERGPRSVVTGELVCGDETLSDKQLAANRCDLGDEILAHPLDDDYHKVRSPQWDKVKVPFLSAGNWGGQGLHARGNFEGFVRAAAPKKWMEIHGIEHWTHFYTDYGINIQKQFLAHFLKDENNGWDKRPKVQLQVRHLDKFVERFEDEWPIARTEWTKFYLHTTRQLLLPDPAKNSANLEFEAFGDGLTFISGPLSKETEITGPIAARLFVSSSTTDADLFLVFRVFTPDLREVTFQGANDPHTPVAQGWLRASHRKLDPVLTKPYRPYHTHDEIQPLSPGVPVGLDIELVPTSVVVPAGYRLGLSIRGKDYEFAKKTGIKVPYFKNELLGCGPFLHNDPRDRPAKIFGGRTTLHIDPEHPNYVLVPVIPKK